eukprot:g3368.t1
MTNCLSTLTAHSPALDEVKMVEQVWQFAVPSHLTRARSEPHALDPQRLLQLAAHLFPWGKLPSKPRSRASVSARLFELNGFLLSHAKEVREEKANLPSAMLPSAMVSSGEVYGSPEAAGVEALQAKEEAERRAKEEAERKAKEESERKAQGKVVTRIKVRAGDLVDRIAFVFADGSSVSYGGTGGSQKEDFVLEQGDFVTQVLVRQGDSLDQIVFVTSKGRRSPTYGGRGGTSKEFKSTKPIVALTVHQQSMGWLSPVTGIETAATKNRDGADTHLSMDNARHTNRMLHYCGRDVGQSGYENSCGGCDGRCGPTKAASAKLATRWTILLRMELLHLQSPVTEATWRRLWQPCVRASTMSSLLLWPSMKRSRQGTGGERDAYRA